jgi:hypothetical protein
MKEIFLFFLSVVLLCRLALAEDSPWYVSFYQDPNAGGLSAKLDVSPVGTAIPIDEFAKYHLEGENGISEIRYKLPQGVVLVCFTRRFFKSTDSDIANFINNHQILKHYADQPGIIKHYADQLGIRFGQDVLVLKGTGNDEVAQLWVDQKSKYDNRIRSAMLQKLAQ